ncbi:hypothetical protein HDIA_2254 [Hartmannibacter diazotrophicus]|uniref:Uncharacterized protein n=1 Tax=Hartmannibacter diazotrophicus TaxID=1482074 RepID=A0A2C9D8B7_9HYPH|nr:hypothetical protein [Hartmannibacter diazotrophicus]SON55795.1 hypothetical protein HDIA_2254 [Hartmannibacter diazotrophicus]
MTEAPSSFRGLLAEIAAAAGPEAALAVQRARGGTRVDIPADVKPGHWLADCVGLETARTIAKALAVTDADNRVRGVRHEVLPIGETGVMRHAKRRFADLIAEGKSVRAAARAVGVTERTGFEWNGKIKGRDNRQGRLL